MNRNTLIKHIVISIAVLVLINIASQYVYKRFDLTQDKRYTLSESAKQTIQSLESPLIIDVFLEGNLSSDFRRLRSETKQLLEEFVLQNKLIKINYIDPLEDEDTRNRNVEELTKSGLTPYISSETTNNSVSKEMVFPWAFASYQGNITKIPLLKKSLNTTLQEQITNSIQHLEYTFVDGFRKISAAKEKKIAILKGNGELEDLQIADLITSVRPYYNIAPFTLDSVANNPNGTLKLLKTYDLVIAAKPTEAFTEEEKLVLDQYTMSGGKSIWLTESVVIDRDSLQNSSNSSVAILRDLNLNDFFFKYGVRINPVIVNDMYSAPIWLAMGEGSQAQFQPLRWPYSPLAGSNPNHSITNNIELVKFDFASQIDTLKNKAKKTILLQSSRLTKLQGVPKSISLDIVTEEPDPNTYTSGPQNLAVLIEGEISSAYKNRIRPFEAENYIEECTDCKLIVIADGDIIKNDVVRNQPQELGFDRWTGNTLGNKEFLINAINYLLDDTGLMSIRSKEVAIAYLNNEKAQEEKGTWQLINTLLPILILVIFGILFNYLRKRKYA
ncbi:gliding motility-associated ABC transporter substrate-binding protein GldG [Winogradskyella sp. 3972H.M.0a.05]|uniref:gliding motility-associated ABC transporter substrate-binding protein GldG n=1 Tax=Winogradskyella sp. 3972H.M.0a.05 TaxID=2950277 RepID=UPI003395EC92